LQALYATRNSDYPNTSMVIKIDSIAIKRFHYFGSGLWENYVWFKKIGQYVCWRDKYIQEDGTLKWLDLTFPNRYKNLSSGKYCLYSQFIMCDQQGSTSVDFNRIFPTPLNDTVYVKLSSFRQDKFWN